MHVLFHPVLKAYPTQHSWVITAHISLDDLDRQLHMFNHQKTLAHQLLVKLQDQPLASHFVPNAVLGSIIQTISMNPTSQSYYQQYSCSKLSVNLKTCHHLKIHDLRQPITLPGRFTKMANRHNYHKTYMGNQAMCKQTDTGTDQTTEDSSPCHIHPKYHKVHHPSK